MSTRVSVIGRLAAAGSEVLGMRASSVPRTLRSGSPGRRFRPVAVATRTAPVLLWILDASREKPGRCGLQGWVPSVVEEERINA